MRKLIFILSFCTVIVFTETRSFALADSSHSVVSKFIAGLDISILNTSNWQGVDLNSYSFSTDMEYDFIRSRPLSRDFFNLKLELGFTRILDSVWYKHADQLCSQYILKVGQNKWSQSANCMLNAKLLNSYEYVINSQTGNQNKIQTGTFFSPSSLEIGYGINYIFLKQSIINFSLATARFRISSENRMAINDGSIALSRLGKSYVLFDYGFSLQYSILHDITKIISLHSSGKMFLKGLHREKVEMDISQKWMLKITKSLHLRTDVKIVYAPVISHKMQLRNEFMVGFYYDSFQ